MQSATALMSEVPRAGLVASDGFVVELRPLLVLIAGGLVCGSLPTVLFYAGLQRIAASQASVLTLCEPLVAVVVGVVVWGEALGGGFVLGGAVIIARAQR